MEPVHVIVLTDADSGWQALYVGADLIEQDDTIYACDIANATEGKTVEFTHMIVRIPKDVESYPDRFEQILLWPPVDDDT